MVVEAEEGEDMNTSREGEREYIKRGGGGGGGRVREAVGEGRNGGVRGWHVVSWLLAALLTGVAVIIAYLGSQLLFAVIIMDAMSRITERLVSGREQIPLAKPLLQQYFFLFRQEIPRTTLPVLILLLLMILSWLTPLGPALTLITSGVAVIFLTWDNTDLVPARRLQPFSVRFRFLLKTLPFHLGFGLLFLVPVLNILLLSFAPVGATLYYLEYHNR